MGLFKTRVISIVFALTTVANVAIAKDRYLVVFKSQEGLQHARSNARSGEFLGTRGVDTTQFLDHVEMAVVSADAAQMQDVSRHANVAYIEKEFFFKAPKFKKSKPATSYVEVRGMDLPWGIAAIKAPEAWAITKGEGARVMVLDTGIDANHPDLKNRLEKAKGFTGTNTFADDVGHGTHVSGTILADGAGNGLLGVAPAAKLLMGKVCSTAGCSTTAIASGVNWAIQEKVDVVSMSLGGPYLFPTQAQAYKKAEQANIVIVAASGNDGSATISYPAAIETVLAVGAVKPDFTKADFSQYGPQLGVVAPGVDTISSVPLGTGRDGSVMIDLGQGAEAVKNTVFGNSSPKLNEMTVGDFVFVGLGKPEDIKGKNLQGKLALIQRGEIAFEDKVKNLMGTGITGVVIFNNDVGLINGGLTTVVNFPVVMIEQAVGQKILEKLKAGTVSASIGVVATDYASFQGTSMATPHVSGLVALVRSVNKNLNPAQVRALVKSTATPLTPNTKNEYGSGLVNAEQAVLKAKAAVNLPRVAGF